jgi:hypothetical protein
MVGVYMDKGKPIIVCTCGRVLSVYGNTDPLLHRPVDKRFAGFNGECFLSPVSCSLSLDELFWILAVMYYRRNYNLSHSPHIQMTVMGECVLDRFFDSPLSRFFAGKVSHQFVSAS